MPRWTRDTFNNNKAEGWQKTVDMMVPDLKQQYPDCTYEQACEEIKKNISDADDYAQVCEYIKKFF